MSRAYRLRVREKDTRVLRAHDHVSTQLELLEVLPPADMAALLAEELARRGYEEKGGHYVRKQDGVAVRVDPKSGTVTVEASAEERVDVEAERQGVYVDDAGPSAKQVAARLKDEARKELDRVAAGKEAALQSQLTDRLEGHLADLRQELDSVANRVVAEGLKRKAAQMGQIKEMTEDPESGSLTIVLEV